MAHGNVVSFFRGSTGLDTKNAPSRIKGGPITSLAEAVNVDVSSSGRINRRRGYTATTLTGAVHSLFSHGDILLGVFSDGLGRIADDFGSYTLLDPLVRNRVSYAVVNNIIFYTDGFSNACVLQNGSTTPWPSFVQPPDAPREDIYTPFPSGGSLLAVHLARMAVAHEDVVFMSEPMQFGTFNLYKWFFPFPGHVTSMFICDGANAAMYVGATSGLYALVGRVREEIRLKQIDSELAPIPGTVAYCKASLVGADAPSGLKVPMWLAPAGICVGDDNGTVRCLTEDKIDIPDGLSVGSSVVFDDFFRTYCH